VTKLVGASLYGGLWPIELLGQIRHGEHLFQVPVKAVERKGPHGLKVNALIEQPDDKRLSAVGCASPDECILTNCTCPDALVDRPIYDQFDHIVL
jgi:hypothetical protein